MTSARPNTVQPAAVFRGASRWFAAATKATPGVIAAVQAEMDSARLEASQLDCS
jgi:hypothetical protein